MLEAEGADDLELTFIWETGEFTNDVSVMESVLANDEAVGVRGKLQQFEPGGDISSWRQGKTGDWDVLGNGYGNQTGLALTTLQGMYAGTAEKEATRDTYHGYVFPEITAKIQAASSEPDPTSAPHYSTPHNKTSGTPGLACGASYPTHSLRNALGYKMLI